MATKKTDEQLARAAAGSEASVGKIRDILFGTHIKDYESRFRHLETKIDKDTARLNKSLTTRIDKLESALRDALSKLTTNLTDALAAETQERRKDREDSVLELQQFAKETHEKAIDLEEAQSSDAHELRAALKAQGDEIKALIEQTRGEILGRLETESSRLSHDKLGRERLAGMLIDIAERMHAEPDSAAKPKPKSKR